MPAVTLWTYQDAIEHCMDYIGVGAPTPDALRDARRSVQLAYRDLDNDHPWSYLWKAGRINTVASQSSSTITYDHTGGTYERMVTLASGTWPTWTLYATLLIDNVPYQVAERKSDTVLTLTIGSNPGADVAAGTSYTLYRDTYPLPCDFRMSYTPHTRENWGGLCYVHPREWMAERSLTPQIGQPRIFTIQGDENLMGALAMIVYPAPSSAFAIDFLYQRYARPLVVDDYHDGTATVPNSSTAVTGSNTAWSSKHVGAVLRFAADALDLPTGLAGANQFVYERVIMSVESATELVVDLILPEALTGVKYRISDPLDLEYGVMLTPLLRGCEKQMSTARIMKDKPNAAAAYREAILEAKANDTRIGMMRSVGGVEGSRWNMKYQPLGADD